jgi:hypothetical protein
VALVWHRIVASAGILLGSHKPKVRIRLESETTSKNRVREACAASPWPDDFFRRTPTHFSPAEYRIGVVLCI